MLAHSPTSICHSPYEVICKELTAYESRPELLDARKLHNLCVVCSYATEVNQEELHTKVVAAKAA